MDPSTAKGSSVTHNMAARDLRSGADCFGIRGIPRGRQYRLLLNWCQISHRPSSLMSGSAKSLKQGWV